MRRIVFFDGDRAYWSFPDGEVTRSRVYEPGSYIFTDEAVQMFTGGWQGLALTWPDKSEDAGAYLANALQADLVPTKSEFDRLHKNAR